MIVKPAPRLATILCRWLGRLAMPMGEALSGAVGAILRFDFAGARLETAKCEAVAETAARYKTLRCS